MSTPTPAKKMNPAEAHAQATADRMIAMLEAGTAPWLRPWAPGELAGSAPMNPTTGKAYRGGNSLWLRMQGFTDPRWMTYKQAAALGAQVRKGEKSTAIEYWKWHDKKDGADSEADSEPTDAKQAGRKPCTVFYARVFNGQQIDGLEPLPVAPVAPEWARHAQAEDVLTRLGVPIIHGGNEAFYRPAMDRIHLPNPEAFSRLDGYYATALHEAAHATGHPSRLARDMAHPFGSEGYAREELVAELASMNLGERLGIGHDPGQHAAYVKSWIKILKDHPRALYQAARQAEDVCKFLGVEHAPDLAATADQALSQERQATAEATAEAFTLRQQRDEAAALLREAVQVATPKPSPAPAAPRRAGRRMGGFGMLEIIAVAGLSSVVLAAAVTVYFRGKSSADASIESAHVRDVAQRVTAAYSSTGNFDRLNTTSAVREKLLPPSMLRGNGTTDQWGGQPAVSAADCGTGVCSSFVLSYNAVPAPSCLTFVKAAGPAATSVKINNLDVDPADTSAAALLCSQQDTAQVDFLFSRGHAAHANLVTCQVQPDQTRTVACPTGQISYLPPYSVNGITQERSSFCNQAYGAVGWTPWTPTASTCAPVCVAPGTKSTSQSQPANCPAGQVTSSGSSTFTQVRTGTTTYTCPAPTGSYTTNPTTWGAWSPTAGSVCAPACVAPATTTATQNQTAGCPAGQVTSSGAASFTQSRTATTSYACANPTGSATSSVSYSPWTPTAGSVCAPACVAPAPSAIGQSQTASCPAGQVTSSGSSTFTQTRTATTTYTCPSPTGSATSSIGYSPWSPAAGSVCAPACVAPAPKATSGSQTASCPSGQVTSTGASTFTQTRTGTISYTCSSPTGSVTSSTTWNPWGPSASTVCAPPPPPSGCWSRTISVIPYNSADLTMSHAKGMTAARAAQFYPGFSWAGPDVYWNTGGSTAYANGIPSTNFGAIPTPTQACNPGEAFYFEKSGDNAISGNQMLQFTCGACGSAPPPAPAIAYNSTGFKLYRGSTLDASGTCASASCTGNNGTYNGGFNTVGRMDATFNVSCGSTTQAVSYSCSTPTGGGSLSCSAPVSVGACSCKTTITGTIQQALATGTASISCTN